MKGGGSEYACSGVDLVTIVWQRQQHGADDDVERWSAGAASAALVVQLDRDVRQQQLCVRHGAAAGAADGRVARRGFRRDSPSFV